MYAEYGAMFPYYPHHQLHHFCCSDKSNASLDAMIPSTNLISQPAISDYSLGEEGDLFKAPEHVIQETFMGLDPIAAAISMISCGDDVISPQSLTISDIESSIESGQLLSEVFYECRKDLLAKNGNQTPLSEVLDIKILSLEMNRDSLGDGSFGKSVSANCLRSMDSACEGTQEVDFLDCPYSELGAVYGMRRAFSEGDIKTLGNGDISLVQSSMGQLRSVSSCTADERREKLSRYWNKKSKRNFGRKIKDAKIPSTNLISQPAISDYSLGEEGDLFKAPEPVIQETFMGLDPIAAAISMISCGDDVISPQSLTISDIELSIESGQLLSEVFYECRQDLLAKNGNQTPLSEVLDIKIRSLEMNRDSLGDGSFGKSVSASCLRSMDSAPEGTHEVDFLDCPDSELGAVYGMRRAFSEGDIKTLGNGDISLVPSSMGQPRSVSSCTADERREKLSRYWNKKSKRNFGRKIKYACRKVLADSQPRIRGRFARTEEK